MNNTTRYFLFIIIITLTIVVTVKHSPDARQKNKVYTLSYSEIKPMLGMSVPAKYLGLLQTIVEAKKQGKSYQEISAMTKKRYGIGEEDMEPILKKMKIPSKMIKFTRDMILNKNPILEIVIKGAVTPPRGSPQYDDIINNLIPAMKKTMKEFQNRVRFKIIMYPGGIMGDEPDFIRKIKLGELQFAGGTLNMGEMICPALSVFDLPFLFDYEPELYYDELKYCQIDWIFDKAAPSINRLLEEDGFILGSLVDAGCYASIATSKVPIKKSDDLNKIAFYAFPQARISGEINKAFGFRKTIICKIWDLPSITATGMLDASACAWFLHVLMQATPYFKYVTDYPIRGFVGGIALQSKEMLVNMINMTDIAGQFIGMTRKDAIKIARKLLLVQYRTTRENMRRHIREKEAAAKRALLKSGIYEIVKIPEAELTKIKNKILPLYNKLADKKGSYPRWFLDEILGYREEYRKLKKQGKLTDRWHKKGIYPDGYDEYAWINNWGSSIKVEY